MMLRVAIGAIPSPSKAIVRAAILAVLQATPASTVAAGDAGAQEAMRVPPGTTLTMDHALQVRQLVVEGVLRVGGGWIRADLVRVGPGGIIEADRGVDGADAHGADAAGGTGGEGKSVLVEASTLVVERGGRIVAGDGGRGGGAQGVGIVRGGAGGRGGSVLLQAGESRIEGSLLPGPGGAGGDAVPAPLGSLPGPPER